MKKLKKAAFALVAAVLVLSVTACSIQLTGNNGQQERTPSKTDVSDGEASHGTSKENTGETPGEINDSSEGLDASLSKIYPAQKSLTGEAKWGYIDTLGNFVIQPVFSQASRFQANQLAVVGVDDKVGIIDRTGKFLVSPVYNNISDYSDGLAIAYDGKGNLVLDEGGNVLSERYSYIGSYNTNRAVYSIAADNGEWLSGYLDEKGKPVSKAAFQQASDFEGDRAVVKTLSGQYALIDSSYNVVKTFDYSFVGRISDGMMRYQLLGSTKFGFLDKRGNEVIPPSFLEAEDFVGGYAIVNISEDFGNRKVGLIDKKGQFVITPQYNDVLQLGEGMAAVGVPNDPENIFAGSRFALADTKGVILTDFVFDSINPFKDGIASVQDDYRTFFIDRSGSKVDRLPSAEGYGSMEKLNGLIYATIDQRSYYMDEQAAVIYKPSTETTLENGIVVSEGKYNPNRDHLVYYPILSKLESLKIEKEINDKLREIWTNSTTMTLKPIDSIDHHFESSFTIGFHAKNLLVLNESGYDYPFGAAHGMPLQEYVHVDLKTGAFYELKDLFKSDSDYTSVLSNIVEKQIAEQSEEMGVWIDSYNGIRQDHSFCLTQGTLNLYFHPYEIAPYAAGFPTFEIPLADIEQYIDKTGEFWLSFN